MCGFLLRFTVWIAGWCIFKMLGYEIDLPTLIITIFLMLLLAELREVLS